LTDAETGIKFATWGQERAGQGVFTFGMALPSDALEKDATEYIGYLVRTD
jgi:cellobiose dehydrogenase (acceptor)